MSTDIVYCEYPCLLDSDEEKDIICKQREICALRQSIPAKAVCIPMMRKKMKNMRSIIEKADMHTYGLSGELSVYGSSKSVSVLQRKLAEIDGLKIAVKKLTKKINLIYKILEDKSLSEKEQIEKIELVAK